MIVNTMSLLEIHAELHRDIESLESSIWHKADLFASAVKKANRYPLVRHYPFTSKTRKNRYHVLFIAYKRSDWKKAIFKIYCIYNRPDGLYMAILDRNLHRTYIFPPHFFARYRERVVKDATILPEDLIHLFASRTWTMSFKLLPTELQKQLKSLYGYPKDELLQFQAMIPDGLILGERTGDIILGKTIITREMLFENQIEGYEALHARYRQSLVDKLPKHEADYILSLEASPVRNSFSLSRP